MSLINEALKKAQKQRTGENTSLSGLPGVGGEPAARIAKRAKPVGFNSLLTRIGIGAGAVAVIVVVGILLARYLTSQPAAPAAAKPAAVAPAETVAKVPDVAPAKPAEAPAAGPSKFVLPAAPVPASVTPAPVVTENKTAVTPAVVPAAPPPPPKPVPAAKLEPKAITYIENIRVAGIRASGGDSKVLMNDRVYRVGDTVEHELGLKLTGITPNSLSFEDERGAKYTRNF